MMRRQLVREGVLSRHDLEIVIATPAPVHSLHVTVYMVKYFKPKRIGLVKRKLLPHAARLQEEIRGSTPPLAH
jgi:hypothetical protein